MKIIAHRGSSFMAPENTLASFRLAIEEKADGVELDVHRTRDGKAAVIHDEHTLRTTGMRAAVRDVSMDELKLLDAGCWKGHEWRCETVPELSEVLGVLPENMLAFIEIKCGPEILPALADIVPAIGTRALFVGFSLETMALTKQQFPGNKVLWNLETYPQMTELVARARNAGIDGFGLGFSGAINAELVKQIHGAGLEVFVWTVDDVEQAKNLRSLNVDYLATNRPGWVRESLG
jgi:glycerophosphoryl diester phosphodiesterase